jgi:hypothetical protein
MNQSSFIFNLAGIQNLDSIKDLLRVEEKYLGSKLMPSISRSLLNPIDKWIRNNRAK